MEQSTAAIELRSLTKRCGPVTGIEDLDRDPVRVMMVRQ